jgi:hypothetical protein
MLREYPPHILIATPTALIDVLRKEPEVLQLSTLSTVVVDEVDWLLQALPQKSSKYASEKAARSNQRHPDVLKTLLDVLYTNTKTNASYPLRKRLLEMKLAPIHRPQLIMLSATMRNRLRTAFFGAYGWFRRGKVLKLIKASSGSRPAHGLNRTITHHVLVVSQDGSVKNIAGARKARASTPSDFSEHGSSCGEQDEEEEEFIFDEDDEAPLDDETDTGEEILFSRLYSDIDNLICDQTCCKHHLFLLRGCLKPSHPHSLSMYQTLRFLLYLQLHPSDELFLS